MLIKKKICQNISFSLEEKGKRTYPHLLVTLHNKKKYENYYY